MCIRDRSENSSKSKLGSGLGGFRHRFPSAIMECAKSYRGIPARCVITAFRKSSSCLLYTSWGAVTSLFAALGTNLLLCSLEHRRLDYWSPRIFALAFTAGIVSLVVISLLTTPEPQSDVELFFARLQTPSDASPVDAMSQPPDGEHDIRWQGLSREPSRDHAESCLLYTSRCV